MTPEGRNDLAWQYAQRTLAGTHPDMASRNLLRTTLVTVRYRFQELKVNKWPAWAQYIFFRYQYLTRSRSATKA